MAKEIIASCFGYCKLLFLCKYYNLIGPWAVYSILDCESNRSKSFKMVSNIVMFFFIKTILLSIASFV